MPPPSSQYREHQRRQGVSGVGSEQLDQPLPSNSAIKVVPENGYGQLNGQTVFTHGVEFGVAKAASRDLREATDAWLKAVAQSNPGAPARRRAATAQDLAAFGAQRRRSSNPSPLGGQERIDVYTTFLADGTLFYYLTVAPEKDAEAFQDAFQRIGESIRLTEAR